MFDGGKGSAPACPALLKWKRFGFAIPLTYIWPELKTLILNAGNVAQFSNAAPEGTGGTAR